MILFFVMVSTIVLPVHVPQK
uniref:Uncharacterized protein n=1 Tax=Anguilla anguilla TaxID=7936 RepID=A0A0E9SRZ4_ANGAN